MIAFPPLAPRTGLGVGLDLPWIEAPAEPVADRRTPSGFHLDQVAGDRIASSVVRHLEGFADDYRAVFFSWQPKSRSRLRIDDYKGAWDSAFDGLPASYARGLHQTTFNLGALEAYDRRDICRFTNDLARRYDLKWVNEDVGLWSINGRPLPYPLAPWLTPEGLKATIANTREVQAALEIPLLAEFPGFSEGTSVYVGKIDAYDFFAELAVATDVAVTLDLGHLLSWRWVRGHRGEALYGDLERLPLAHCAELHLSGCAVDGHAFFDYHHGVLMAEQLELLRRLLPLCPELRLITYEDPALDGFGELLSTARPGFDELQSIVGRWAHPTEEAAP